MKTNTTITNHFLFLMGASLLLLSSCLATKAPPLPAEEPEIKLSDWMLEEDSIVYETLTFDLTDTIPYVHLLAKIERQSCFGKCPVYKAAFYSDGKIIYEGIENVDRRGKYVTRVDEATVNRIKTMAERVDYFRLSGFYPTHGSVIDDLPVTITYVSFIFKDNQVTDAHNSPAKLHRFERFLDEIIDTQNWTLIK